MSKTTLTIKGGGLDELKKHMLELARRPYVKVGVVGTKASESHGELTNVELAVIHEFGTADGSIPSRSFLRSTANAKRVAWLAMMGRIAKLVLKGKLDLKKGLGLLGERASGDVRATIQRGIAPPLKPATIKAKGSSKPLIDSGQLVQSLGYEIRPDGD